MATGRSQGENRKLIEQVQKKLQKGKTPVNIAEDLEEPLEDVKRICEAVEKCGLEADPQEIYDEMQEMTTAQ